MKKYLLQALNQRMCNCNITLPGSKSESNRLLIMNSLSGNILKFSNLSAAGDTLLLQKLLLSGSKVINTRNAGTVFRFLTAYYAYTGQDKILTGTVNMQQRPVEYLVDALLELGAEIQYLGKYGYPPIQIRHSVLGINQNEVSIRGGISSQFISGLMMIAPLLPQGLTIHLQGNIVSKYYIELTQKLMEYFGVKVNFYKDSITISPQKYSPGTYSIESDWSSASYWYSIAVLSNGSEIHLNGLRENSYQGDKKITELMKVFGISTEFFENKIVIRKKTDFKVTSEVLHFDFRDTPDLAQTLIVLCAALRQKATFAGIHHLRLKETDRIIALQSELEKINTRLVQINNDCFELNFISPLLPESCEINPFSDHRMAMAFTPLAMIIPKVVIEDPDVVNKSYPGFWEDWGKCLGNTFGENAFVV